MTRNARDAILEQIDFHDDGDDDPARISAVVEDAIVEGPGPTVVFEAFAVLFREGEVYEKKPGHVRRTVDGGRRDGGD